MLEFYQNLPSKIDPVFFQIGSFSIYWYSIMYLVGFGTVSGILYWRVIKKENFYKWENIFDFILYSFLGGILGGRIGYVIFYNLDYFWNNPLKIFFPFSSDGYTGIYGMSFHGGVIGFVLTALIFCRKKKINFWQMADFVLPAIPAGYFFGRMGNFINGELYGRATDKIWGMYFDDGILRHSSQLYEAFFEGIVAFIILWIVRNKFLAQKGFIMGLYLITYGIFRFVIEFFREPDWQLGFIVGNFTMGQILSGCMIAIGYYIIFRVGKK